jgi:hypothetical protein
VQEAPIEMRQSGDIVEAKLADGKQVYLKLRREPGVDGKGVVLKNVKYFDAIQNDGFQLYKSIEHRADLGDISFTTPIATRSSSRSSRKRPRQSRLKPTGVLPGSADKNNRDVGVKVGMRSEESPSGGRRPAEPIYGYRIDLTPNRHVTRLHVEVPFAGGNSATLT